MQNRRWIGGPDAIKHLQISAQKRALIPGFR
jgi:hypothetical protein